MENKNSVLIVIVVMLFIFLPLTIIGFIFKDNKNLLDENPGHDTYYKDTIWFYDENDNFLSKYECQTKVCDFTVPTIDDSTYGINYYKEGTMTKVPVISNKYTFITDGAVIYLYGVSNGMTLGTFKAVKNYSTNLDNNAYIVQNSDDLWGVITIGDTIGPVLPFNYDFIGIAKNGKVEGDLSTDKFIVLKDNKWYIVDNENSALTGYIDDPIIEYTNEYVFSKNAERIKVHSYENYEFLTDLTIKDYIIEDKYIGIITDNSLLIYENLGVNYIKNITITNSTDKIDLEKTDNKLHIKINDVISESIELG